MMASPFCRHLAFGAVLLLTAGCADPSAPLPTPSEVVLVVNSIESSLSVLPVNATSSAYRFRSAAPPRHPWGCPPSVRTRWYPWASTTRWTW